MKQLWKQEPNGNLKKRFQIVNFYDHRHIYLRGEWGGGGYYQK